MEPGKEPRYKLTTEHSQSSYGQPVLVDLDTGQAYGIGDILPAGSFTSAGPETSGAGSGDHPPGGIGNAGKRGGGSVTRGNKREQPGYKSARFEIGP